MRDETQKQQSTQGQTAANSVLSSALPDDPEQESDTPLHCSLQWDALEEAGNAADAAITLVEERMRAYMECIARDPRAVWPVLPPAPGGEYVDAGESSPATASTVVAVTVSPLYRLGQIEAIRGTINGCRRHLKHILGITK
jgi:hypothetical protein